MAMDEDIRAALTEIKADVKDGFKDLNGRIDGMVTKGEFNATVQRLDSEHGTLRRDFSSHETRSAAHEAEVRSGDQAVKTELRNELEGFRVTTRWAIGLSAAGAGVLVSLAQVFINSLKLGA